MLHPFAADLAGLSGASRGLPGPAVGGGLGEITGWPGFISAAEPEGARAGTLPLFTGVLTPELTASFALGYNLNTPMPSTMYNL